MLRRYASVLVGTMVLYGCAEDPKVAALEDSISQLAGQLQVLRDSVESLSFSSRLEALVRNSDRIAFLTPGSDGYSLIRTDLGQMTIALQDVQPYANGTRVTLRIGNVTSATINGAKATVEWGSVDSEGVVVAESTKSREVNLGESLRSGAWTNVQIVLEGVPPTDLGFVRLRDVTHTAIRLLQ